MKNIYLLTALVIMLSAFNSNYVIAADTVTPEPMIKIEIPASDVDKIDVKYEASSASSASTALTETKTAAKKAVSDTKKFTDKTVKKTKTTAKKSAENTKSATDKAIEATKSAANKAAAATKDATKKTVDNTKDIIDNMNPNKTVTKAELQADSNIKTLKNERNELKSAYNSRIKDINAKIKATENYTDLTQAQKQSRIYSLNKEKAALEKEKADYIEKYNQKIETAKTKKRNLNN